HDITYMVSPTSRLTTAGVKGLPPNVSQATEGEEAPPMTYSDVLKQLHVALKDFPDCACPPSRESSPDQHARVSRLLEHMQSRRSQLTAHPIALCCASAVRGGQWVAHSDLDQEEDYMVMEEEGTQERNKKGSHQAQTSSEESDRSKKRRKSTH